MNDLIIKRLESIRKELHAYPEISEQEYATQQRILKFLSTYCNAFTSEIAQTGVLAIFDSEHPGPAILIRSDIDALPIQEINTFKHSSKTKGVSHKCGHDGHTTILLGLAIQLTKKPITIGKVILLFQPAEENGMGAQSVLNDKTFMKNKIDYVFALHNLPGYRKHEIIIRENEFTGNVKSIIIKMNGKTAHAAEPENGHNPAMAIADILHFAKDNTYNHPNSKSFFLITPIYVSLGEKAYGISPGYGEVHLTIRSWSAKLMKEKCLMLEKFIKKKSKQHKLIPKISWTQVFHANCNHPDAIKIIKKAVQANQLQATEIATPFKWGEDFGLFTQKFKGAMFGVGAGKRKPALHNPDYDFPDEITPTGIAMFQSIIKEVLNN